APVADTALNGAQIQSLLELVQSYLRGEVSRESAKALMLVAFPTIDAQEAEGILGPKDFKPVVPKPENPFGSDEDEEGEDEEGEGEGEEEEEGEEEDPFKAKEQ